MCLRIARADQIVSEVKQNRNPPRKAVVPDKRSGTRSRSEKINVAPMIEIANVLESRSRRAACIMRFIIAGQD